MSKRKRRPNSYLLRREDIDVFLHLTGGATLGTATDLAGAVYAPENADVTVFNLGNGFYSGLDLTRPNITLSADNRHQAKLGPIGVSAPDITLDGIDTTYGLTSPITVSAPGARIQNCRIHDFNRTQYGNGIWVLKSALNPANRTYLTNNLITDWGGPSDPALQGAGILVGASPPEVGDITQVTCEIVGNRIVNGPLTPLTHYAGIGAFHPCYITHNYINTVFGAGISLKTYNSRVSLNELTNIRSDGALYNRFPAQGNNVWERNLIYNCDVGIDHFMGKNVTYRENVIHSVGTFGRIKNQGDILNLMIENNTFYNATDAAGGWSWDSSVGGFIMREIFWRNNIWHTTTGPAIQDDPLIRSAWDENGNIFWLSTPPLTKTGGGRTVANPRLANPPSNFTAQAAPGRGATWPITGL